MPILSCPPATSDQLATLRRLIAFRWLALVLMAGLTLALPVTLDIPLATAPLLAIIAIAGVFNGIAGRRTAHTESASSAELLTQLLIDIAVLSALVFFSGGATNPLVSLLL